MNERLTELYRASRPKESLASQDEFKSANALLGSEVEKFARLIIEECVRVGEHEFLHGSTVPVFPAHQIKQHFGVEPPPKLGPGVNFRPTYPDEE